MTKLLLFDFDLTIAVVHLYHELARGIDEDATYVDGMSESEWFAKHAEAMLGVYRATYDTPEMMDTVFGGAARRERLLRFFTAIQAGEGGVKNEVYVITHGYTEVVKACLKRAGYDGYFRDVIGVDHRINDTCMGNKLDVVKHLLRQHGVQPCDAVLVDDDHKNLINERGVTEVPALWVWQREGMRESDLDRVERFANGAPAPKTPLYTEKHTLRVPAEVAAAVEARFGRYYTLGGVSNLASAVQKCNAVPLARRIEGVRLVSVAAPPQPKPKHVDPMAGMGLEEPPAAPASHLLLFATRVDALDFSNMLLKYFNVSIVTTDVQGDHYTLPKDELAPAPAAAPPAAAAGPPGKLCYTSGVPLSAALANSAPAADGSVAVTLRPEEAHVAELLKLLRDPAMRSRLSDISFTVKKAEGK
eukprot:TRINITY_DN4825_c0_g2_i1.p2 TRINITY_DN4825_c0_g2~~TRINITY_DN4825_c0_g2_i1.p2  ORF type:complete len:438 (+),score=160.44 TRINITY_DN4825_c0_g2_i1:65-1315(+)